MDNIYIIGFMATGKSSVGKELARLLKRDFLDLDAYLEEKSGKRVAEIFLHAGEPFFRRLEARFLAEVARGKNTVISCGGGVVTGSENIRVMKRTGRIVYLTASLEEILRRSAPSAERPLLNAGGDKQKAAEKLMAERAGLYAQAADLTVDTTALTVEQAAEAVLRLLAGDAR